jgi:hypothetical protein
MVMHPVYMSDVNRLSPPQTRQILQAMVPISAVNLTGPGWIQVGAMFLVSLTSGSIIFAFDRFEREREFTFKREDVIRTR